jgi:hypothetical protein
MQNLPAFDGVEPSISRILHLGFFAVHKILQRRVDPVVKRWRLVLAKALLSERLLASGSWSASPATRCEPGWPRKREAVSRTRVPTCRRRSFQKNRMKA